MEYHFISILINNSQSGESTVLGELSHEIKDFHKSFNCFQLLVAVAVFLILQTLLWGNKLNWMKANILPWL